MPAVRPTIPCRETIPPEFVGALDVENRASRHVGRGHELERIVAVAAAHHHQRIALRDELAQGGLAVFRRLADGIAKAHFTGGPGSRIAATRASTLSKGCVVCEITPKRPAWAIGRSAAHSTMRLGKIAGQPSTSTCPRFADHHRESSRAPRASAVSHARAGRAGTCHRPRRSRARAIPARFDRKPRAR